MDLHEAVKKLKDDEEIKRLDFYFWTYNVTAYKIGDKLIRIDLKEGK